jgi:hypothetical protein
MLTSTPSPNNKIIKKIHKEGCPNRPIVNRKNAAAYNLAKMLTKKLEVYIPLPYTFNVINSVHLINDLLEIPYDQDFKFASFDIANMYSNASTTDLINIIELICDQRDINIEIKS